MVTVTTVDTLQEAAAGVGREAVYLGGGTLVMRGVNYGDQQISEIVRLRSQDSLRVIRSEGDRIVLGAAATMGDVLRSSDCAALHVVARQVGGPAVRNMATVGGNIFAPHPYGDFAVALLALDARLRMSDGSDLDLETLLAARGSERRLIESVSIMRPAGDDFRFRKVSRVKPKGVSLMSLAAWLPRRAGRIAGARIAYGAMAPTPVRIKAVEAALEGVSLDANSISGAIAAAAQGLNPPDDPLASGWYRTQVAPVHLKRLLLGEGGR
ncbi:FAD binding domain-containing protein [uncultured Roseibium sp.]|uniref:FAD binding domain-containing protein n=1 Tax=uncultured Roseibium sp. TaxID=1936171 RepID=UPI002618226F|nr:FAD binding domain-containing protein [uncultured Roseibium sp.]